MTLSWWIKEKNIHQNVMNINIKYEYIYAFIHIRKHWITPQIHATHPMHVACTRIIDEEKRKTMNLIMFYAIENDCVCVIFGVHMCDGKSNIHFNLAMGW